MKYKDLITNTDIAPYYIPDIVIGRFPITEASKNSDENHLEYKALHNCAWRFAYEDDYYDAENYEYCDVDIEGFCTLIKIAVCRKMKIFISIVMPGIQIIAYIFLGLGNLISPVIY